MYRPNLIQCCVVISLLSNAWSFTSPINSTPLIQPTAIRRVNIITNNHVSSTVLHDKIDSSANDLRDEIEVMKKEALQKLNDLDDKISYKQNNLGVNPDASTLTDSEESEQDYVDRKLVERIAVSNDPFYSTTKRAPRSIAIKKDEALLDGTSWKVSLDIGREPGTWMPKDWGASGDRLKLNLEFEFTEDQLYEREEFLGSIGDAKIVSVKESQMVLSPSLTQGTRNIPVRNGGWRLSKGKGPMGSDLLRFYIEIDEAVSRTNGDVILPAGRIYYSCGFFNMNRPAGSGEKSRYRKKLDDMIIQAEMLDDEIAAAGFFDKFKKNAELFRLKVDMQATAESFQAASVREPDRSILRFSPQGDVGLTKEGGVCCKVNKGVAIEYHILGRFYIAASKE